jgi:mediator of RNA polymerase II transcription subunit 13
MLKSMEDKVPENLRKRFHLEIVPLQSIMEQSTDEHGTQHLGRLKALAFSVFSQCRRILDYKPPYKSLTGLGPSAENEAILKKYKDAKIEPLIPKLFAPPFILDSPKNRQMVVSEFFGDGKSATKQNIDKTSTLFCGYCLSEDQRMLIAAFTDERGELLQTCAINIEIPDRSRRKKVTSTTRRTAVG